MSGLLKTFSQNVGAGSSTRFHAAGKNFRILSGTALTVRFFSKGSEVGIADAVDSGFYLFADEVFDELRIESPTAQTIKFTMGSGEAGAATAVSISGSVEVTNDVGNPLPVSQTFAAAFTQTAVDVGVASAQILAAKANRKFLLVQNNDATATVYLNLTGAAATATDLKLAPGASVVLDQATPSAAITAIASAATAAGAVVVIEG